VTLYRGTPPPPSVVSAFERARTRWRPESDRKTKQLGFPSSAVEFDTNRDAHSRRSLDGNQTPPTTNTRPLSTITELRPSSGAKLNANLGSCPTACETEQ